MNGRTLIACVLTKVREEATANSVPAAAVIQRWQALLGIIGHKGRLGGCVSVVKSLGLTGELLPILHVLGMRGESGTPGGAVKCVDIRRNAGGESDSLAHS